MIDFLKLPIADTRTIVVFLAIVFGLLVLALLLELYRRGRDRRARLHNEWKAVQQIMAEKDLSKPQRELLERMINTRSAENPYLALTMKQRFDECVSAEMNEAHGQGTAAFAERGAILRDIRQHLGLDYVPFGQRILSTCDLHSGQQVWAAKEPVAPNAQWHVLQVSAVDEAYFYLKASENESAPPCRAGEKLRFRLWREEDARYVFSSTVERVDEAPQVNVMAHVHNLKRTQSREHYRIRHDQGVNISLVAAPMDRDYRDIDARPVITKLRGQVSSLSGGGVALIVSQPVPEQVLLRFDLDLPDGQPQAPVTARLVSSAPLAGGRYLLRSAFVATAEDVRERITHYVFKKGQPQSIRPLDEAAE